MALHTGRAEVQEGDYVGAPLNRVARLLAAGHGAQVLVSGATAELVQDHLPQEVHLRDLGTHQLKDLYRPERLFQVVTPDLPADFSPVVTAAHLPPYPGDGQPAAAAPPPKAAVGPGRRRAAAVAGGLVLVLVLVLAGIYVSRGDGDGPAATRFSAVAATTPTVGPAPEGSGVWGVVATPPPAPAFVVLGALAFDAGWKGDAQSLPGP